MSEAMADLQKLRFCFHFSRGAFRTSHDIFLTCVIITVILSLRLRVSGLLFKMSIALSHLSLSHCDAGSGCRGKCCCTLTRHPDPKINVQRCDNVHR